MQHGMHQALLTCICCPLAPLLLASAAAVCLQQWVTKGSSQSPLMRDAELQTGELYMDAASIHVKPTGPMPATAHKST